MTSATRTHSLAIIGGGNMGAALAQGLVDSGRVVPADLAIVEVSAERRVVLGDMFPGCTLAADLVPCRAAVIAVKPLDAPAATTAATAAGAKRVLSIAAGVTLAATEWDSLMNRNLAGAGSGNTRNVRNALRTLRNKVIMNADSTVDIMDETDTSVAWSAAYSTAAGNPIVKVDP